MLITFLTLLQILTNPSVSEDSFSSKDSFKSRATGFNYGLNSDGIAVFMQDLERLRPDLFEEVKDKYQHLSNKKTTASVSRWVGYSIGGATTLVGLGLMLVPGSKDPSAMLTSPSLHGWNQGHGLDDFEGRRNAFDADFEARRKAFDAEFKRTQQKHQAQRQRDQELYVAYSIFASGLGILLGTAILSYFVSPSDDDWAEFAERVEALHVENGHKSTPVRALRPKISVFPQWNPGSMGLGMGMSF